MSAGNYGWKPCSGIDSKKNKWITKLKINQPIGNYKE